MKTYMDGVKQDSVVKITIVWFQKTDFVWEKLYFHFHIQMSGGDLK